MVRLNTQKKTSPAMMSRSFVGSEAADGAMLLPSAGRRSPLMMARGERPTATQGGPRARSHASVAFLATGMSGSRRCRGRARPPESDDLPQHRGHDPGTDERALRLQAGHRLGPLHEELGAAAAHDLGRRVQQDREPYGGAGPWPATIGSPRRTRPSTDPGSAAGTAAPRSPASSASSSVSAAISAAVHRVLDALARQRVDVPGGVADHQQVLAVAPRHPAQPEGRGAHRRQPARPGPSARRTCGSLAEDSCRAAP